MIPYKAKTPETEARHARLSMVDARRLSNKPGVPDELRVFYANLGTEFGWKIEFVVS